ncbi:rod shape-determining protein MreC [candidate division TA06 bacterium]|uniref:Cell shape-determining protein MreC n=1 Tax=candidate division TA06 bacterium TaxID=2250710 RepID=A0A933I9Y4_UNCT6|nr:rod shape-determining protein MreC [candidate division TA06 bacterium]
MNFRLLRKNDWASLAAAVIFSIVLLILPPGAKSWLGERVVGTVFAPLEWPLSRARSLLVSWKENAVLKDQLAKLTLEHSALVEAARQNAGLRQALELKTVSSWDLSAAQISGREPVLLSPDLLIDKGTGDSLQPGMVVISTLGLVGLILNADAGQSTVQTVFSPDSRVSAIDLRSRVLGIYKTQAGMSCLFDRVPLRADVIPGDTIVSSGYGGVFPYGLMLGVVGKVGVDKRKLVLDVEVRPALDFNRINQVLVIRGGQNPPLPLLTPVPSPDTLAAKARRRTSAQPQIRIRAPEFRIELPDTTPLQMEKAPQ